MSETTDLTIIAPMFNEEENVQRTVDRIKEELEDFAGQWEFIMVDDGSTDRTRKVAEQSAQGDPRLRVVGYSQNMGRGKALRTGMAAARGRIVVTTDFDLSYHPNHIRKIYDEMNADPQVDVVLGSAYMPGGSTEGVPWFRLFVSKTGNRILRHAMGGRYWTITCVLRGYRDHVLKALELESDGKEIHLEILSKVTALGYHVKEIPAHLQSRKMGKSKFRFRATSFSHIIFGIFERPMVLFGGLGILFLLIGFLVGAYLLHAYSRGTLNPDRPLMTVLVVMLLGGVQMLCFGFLALQILFLRRQIYIVQKENRQLQAQLSNRAAPTPDRPRKADDGTL
ncbi:MAG: glycosyltransferase family 2 protein [Planctomycetes bacterium]|nr:glycosyltransferase family 2 protein [Planctomycetota bacterium]